MLRSLSFCFLAQLGLLVVSAQLTPLSALQLGGSPAEEWAITLESGRRLGGLEIEEVVARIELQQGDVDVAFFHDVIHHIEKRKEYLQATARYMAPAGFDLTQEFDLFEEKFFVVFTKRD